MKKKKKKKKLENVKYMSIFRETVTIRDNFRMFYLVPFDHQFQSSRLNGVSMNSSSSRPYRCNWWQHIRVFNPNMFEFYQHNDLDTIRFYSVDRRKYQNMNSSKHYGYTNTLILPCNHGFYRLKMADSFKSEKISNYENVWKKRKNFKVIKLTKYFWWDV